MAENNTYVRLCGFPDGPLEWFTKGTHSAPVVRQGTIEQLVSALEPGARPVVLAPACGMSVLAAKLPPLKGARLAQALPYALEELVPDDIDTLHLAVGTPGGDETVPVVAVPRDDMVLWCDAMQRAGIRPKKMVNEVLALPWKDGQWTLLLEDESAQLRTGEYEGFCFPIQQLVPLLTVAARSLSVDDVESLHVLDARKQSEGVPAGLAEISDWNVVHEVAEQPLNVYLQGVGSSSLNLLQGKFDFKVKDSERWRPWRLSAALLLAVVIVQVASLAYQYGSLSALDSQLYARTEQIFRDTFPDIRNVVNPQVQMERKLAELQGGQGVNGFNKLMALGGSVIASINDVNITGIRYRQGELELEVEVGSLQQLDTLKARLLEKSVGVDVKNATSRDDKVLSRIVLKEAGA